MRRLGLGLLLVVQGCAPAAGPVDSADENPALTGQLRRVTKETPSFAGLRSEAGVLTVFFFDEAQRDAAGASLAGLFSDAPPTLVLRPARGQASERLKTQAIDVLSVPGGSSLDFDETTGYLRVGLWKGSALEPAQTKLLELAVPLESVILQVEWPYQAI